MDTRYNHCHRATDHLQLNILLLLLIVKAQTKVVSAYSQGSPNVFWFYPDLACGWLT